MNTLWIWKTVICIYKCEIMWCELNPQLIISWFDLGHSKCLVRLKKFRNQCLVHMMPTMWALFYKIKQKFYSDYRVMHALFPASPSATPPPTTDIQHSVDRVIAFLTTHVHLPCQLYCLPRSQRSNSLGLTLWWTFQELTTNEEQGSSACRLDTSNRLYPASWVS